MDNWSITRKGEVEYSGSFNDCWRELITRYGGETLAQLDREGVRIKRTN